MYAYFFKFTRKQLVFCLSLVSKFTFVTDFPLVTLYNLISEPAP